MGLHAATRVMPVAREWAAADRYALGRTLAFGTVATIAVTIPLLMMPLSQFHEAMDGDRALGLRVILYLVPQALVVGLPIGLACGILMGLRDGRATPRARRPVLAIALVGSMLMFIVLGWVVPEANQAFRELLSGRRVVRGVNELTLAALWTRRLGFALHMRLALAAAPAFLAVFAFSVAAAARGRWLAMASGLAAVVAYYSCYAILPAPIPALSLWVPAVLAAWTPNLILALATFVVPCARGSDPHVFRSMAS
jgi:lipopolysaccharide export LptBFGC system permease protein LptF